MGYLDQIDNRFYFKEFVEFFRLSIGLRTILP